MSDPHVTVRFDNEQLVRIKNLIPRLSGKKKKKKATRSDVVRALVDYALPRFESEADQKLGNEEGRAGDDHSELGSGAEDGKKPSKLTPSA